MRFPQAIRIREVSPRDGLQAEPAQLTTDDKVCLVDMLTDAGFPQINVTSFVSPRLVPNMADAAEVMSRIARRPGVLYDATVPNARGVERAVEARADAVVTFVAASEQANVSNVGKSTADAVRQAEEVITLARGAGLGAIGTVSSAFGSPYGEEITVDDVLRIAVRLAESGATGLALGDTSGEGTPGQVHGFVRRCLDEFPGVEISLHLHDTRGLALANAVAAMDAGATNFDGAVGGIGGSPFTKNSAGNLPTDDLVEMCRRMGIRTGIDQSGLLQIHRFLERRLGHPLDSRAGRLADELGESP